MTKARTDGERIAVVEEKIDQIEKVATERHHFLTEKIDQILHGQQAGASDRADIKRDMAAMKTDIGSMKPHVQTVADAKTFWSVAGKIGAVTTTLGAAGYGAWVWVKPYFTLRGH